MPDPQPPSAPRRPVSIVQFGEERTDDYGWLRDREDPAVLEYLERENAYADAMLSPTAPLRQRLYDEIVGAIEETDVSAAVRWGPYWYYARTFEGRSYPVHCRRLADGPAYPDLGGPGEQVVLDENREAEGHDFCSVGILEVSPDHAIAAVGTDFEGDERHTVTFRSLDGRPVPTESLDGVGYGVVWTSDSRSICYVRVNDAWRPHELWRHVLGTDPATDTLLHREDDERFTVRITRSRDDQALVVDLESKMTTEVLATDPVDPVRLDTVWPRREGVEAAVEHLVAPDGSRWWIAVTNDGARDFRVVAAPAGDPTAYRQVVAGVEGRRLLAVDAFRGYVVVSMRDDGDAKVRVCPLQDGDDPYGDDLYERGFDVDVDESPSTTWLGANPEYATATIRIGQTSLVTPSTDVDVDLASGSRVVRKRKPVRGGYDRDRYVSARMWFTARDGTAVPVSIVHRRDLLGEGAHPGDPPPSPGPVLLYGYGAYEYAIEPTFSSARLPLLDRGVLYTIAHVRGGGELGRAWYEGGRLERKATSFHDFVDVARELVAREFAAPSRLIAMGGSAGGLLVGASLNEAPDAFGGAVAEVPFVDALNTISDPTLPLSVGEWEEWGDPVHDEAAYRRMRSWSPYENVAAHESNGEARRYPELLVLGSLNDTRVSYWEPAKWVARLRAANPENPVVLKTDLGAGHGGPSGRYDAWRERALVYAFVLDTMGYPTT